MNDRRKTGGRQRGVKNKRTLATERAQTEAAGKIAAALGHDAFEGDAHALLMAIYKDAAQPVNIRIDAAKAAIAYEKPKLSTIDAKLEGKISLEQLVQASFEKQC